MAPSVREATPEDWPAVEALLAELGRPDVRGTDDEDAAHALFLAYLERDDAVALVAEADGRVVGFVDLEFRPRLNFTTPQAWIPDLIVSEAERSRGAGAALLARCEALARERDCWSLSLESANWRDRAHAFYLREGLTDAAKSFSKLLGESSVDWPPAPRLPDAECTGHWPAALPPDTTVGTWRRTLAPARCSATTGSNRNWVAAGRASSTRLNTSICGAASH